MLKIKRLTWVVSLLPIAWLLLQFFDGGLGANPIQALTRSLGDWALRFLLLTLAVTPLRMLTGWGRIAGLRRTFGLIAFTYACLHLVSYMGLDQLFDWETLWKDVVKRRYITIGMISFLLMIPLAITSTNSMIKKMGASRWRALHRVVYAIAPLVVLHFFMMIRAGYDRPVLYGLAAAALLIMRMVRATMRQIQDGTTAQ
jgi:sulfoxide reductase heme-binding subunit YedZ